MATLNLQGVLDRLAAFEANTQSDAGRRVSTVLGQGLSAAQKAAARANIGAPADADVLKLFGKQTARGRKVFPDGIELPDGGLSQAAVSGLTSGLAAKANAAEAPVNALRYGFVADYVGTPQYDGQDGTRITCTDNTAAFAAMLDDCIAKKNLTVWFPRGHYGIKVGNVTKDLTGCTLTIVGDGMEQSIIDFVKEDTTNAVYVDETKAQFIAKISNADKVTFQDVWIKATTNRNNIGGNQLDSNAVYYGAIWGLHFDKYNLLKFERARVSHFNYRGINTKTTGATTYAQMSGKVLLVNCEGHDNKATGFWLNEVQELEVIGGAYHHNGQRGTTGTGYGIACSTKVGQATVRGGARFYRNYRKGFDTHGCTQVTIDGALFEDNVLYHFGILGWSTITATGAVSINNVVMSNGYTADSKAWLDDAYTAISAISTPQKTGMLFTIDDRANGQPSVSPMQKIIFNNVKVLAHYNGADKNPNLVRYAVGSIYALQAESTFLDCDFKLTNTKVSTNSVYSASLFERLVGSINDRNFRLSMPDVMTYGTGKYGAVYIVGALTALAFDNVNLQLNQGYIFGMTSNGELIDPNIGNSVKRRFTNCTFEWETFPPVAASSPRLLGTMDYTSVPSVTMAGNVARLGQTKMILPPSPITDFSRQIQLYVSASVAASTPFMEIILDKVTYATFEIFLNVANEKVIAQTSGANWETLTIVQDGTKFTVSSITGFTDTDGATRTKIVLATKAAQTLPASLYYGRITGSGYQYSWGLHRVQAPA